MTVLTIKPLDTRLGGITEGGIHSTKQFNRIKAEKIARENGGHIWPNSCADVYFNGNNRNMKVHTHAPVWVNEIYVKPENGGIFVKGKDVIDPETKWGVRAKDIPEEAIGKRGTHLLFDPEDFEETPGGIYVIPKSVDVLNPAIEKFRGLGKIDYPRSRIPLALEPGKDEAWMVRELWIVHGVGVRPILREGVSYAGGQGYAGDFRASVNAMADPEVEATVVLDENTVFVQMRDAIENCRAILDELSRTVLPEKLEPLRRLLGAVDGVDPHRW